MNKKIKIILIVLISIIGIIVLDTVGARVLKKSPLISKKEKLDGNSYVNKGLLMNTFYCINDDVETVNWESKFSKYTCPKIEKKEEKVEKKILVSVSLYDYENQKVHIKVLVDGKYDESKECDANTEITYRKSFEFLGTEGVHKVEFEVNGTIYKEFTLDFDNGPYKLY